MTLIETRELTLARGKAPVLHNVNFAIQRGEIVTIVGPNGSGKSSFIRALIGAIQPSRGTVTRAPGLRIGYVPQKLHIDPTLPMTVRRFLSLPTRQPRAAIDAALAKAGLGDIAS